MAAKKVAKLSAKDIDVKIERLLFVKQEVQTLNKELDQLQRELEAQYKLSADQKEIINGNNFQMEKVPINQGRNTYDANKLTPFLKAIRGAYNKVIKTVRITKQEIDTAELNYLVKNGKLPEEVVDSCRIDKWTFRTLYKRIERDTKKDSKTDVG